MRAGEATAWGRQGCDEEVVVVRGEKRMGVEMMMGAEMAVDEGDAVSIEEMMETVIGLTVGCGSVSGGVSVAKVRYEEDWMRTWENRRWCACGELMVGISAERASVVVRMATRMVVLEAVARCIAILKFSWMCLDHIAVNGFGRGGATEAADGSMVVALVVVVEANMKAVKGAVGRDNSVAMEDI